jgi:uncharacterized protein YtpQ (UPF0354 family)
MLNLPLKTFVHPGRVYKLEYPEHWDQAVQEEGRACGFGPHERDNVGLWISILPYCVDSEKMAEDGPDVMQRALEKAGAKNLRPDSTLRHFAFKGDMDKDDEGGNYWIVAGGDVLLLASSQVPVGERDEWNPAFERLMTSLQITRDDELVLRRLAVEVLELLRKEHPDQEFELDEKGNIRGKNRVVFLSNLHREIKSSSTPREELIKNFVANMSLTAAAGLGEETWEGARDFIIPVLKPRSYVEQGTATQHILTTDWLGDVIICYVIKNKKFFRFVTGWDVNRWGTNNTDLHQLAIENLAKLPWPKRLEGSRQRDGGRIILVQTDDSLSSSRLLHPDLHHLFSGPLGSPFWVGIPDRDTLVAFSDRKSLKQRIGRKLRKDHDSSAYPITPHPFLVTRDGIALGSKK